MILVHEYDSSHIHIVYHVNKRSLDYICFIDFLITINIEFQMEHSTRVRENIQKKGRVHNISILVFD